MVIDHQEMASIIFNSNLATMEQINDNVSEVTPEKNIGQVLVEKGILPEQTYNELIDFIETLHPENIVIEPDNLMGTAPEITTDNSDESDSNSGPVMAEKSFEEQIAGTQNKPDNEKPSDVMQGLDALYADSDSSPVANSTNDDEFSHIHHTAFTIDLDDVPKHVDPEEENIQPVTTDNSFFTTNESSNNNSIIEAVESVTNKPPSSDETSSLVIEDPFEMPTSQLAEKHIEPEPIIEEVAEEQTQPVQQTQVVHEVAEIPTNSLPKMKSESRELEHLQIQIPEKITLDNSLDEILLFARNHRISDVHLIPNSPVTVRRFSFLVPIGGTLLTSDRIEEMLRNALPKERMDEFQRDGDVEFVYTISGGGRYRVTVMKLRNGWSFTARIVGMSIPSFDAISLPKASLSLTKWAQGMVLVTGPTGCGKTTSLSTLVEHINQERNENIITIEDPIETLFPLGKSHISQRQIGQHTLTQENALKGALRQDPDILMVSELRDMDSIQLAVSAAETGHLVFGTMNTTNAIRTINRLIESFPADEQDVIRSMVSESLRGVISQQLIPRKDGKGVVAAFEVLLVTPAVGNMIRKNEMHQLHSAMVTGRSQGMVLLDDSLMELVKSDTIDAKEAYDRATDKEQFKPFLPKGEGN